MSVDTLETPKVEAPKGYKMPPVKLGCIVLWYEGGVKAPDRLPKPAIVTGAFPRNVSLSVFEIGAFNSRPFEGVRHIDDPDMREADRLENGAWDYCEE